MIFVAVVLLVSIVPFKPQLAEDGLESCSTKADGRSILHFLRLKIPVRL